MTDPGAEPVARRPRIAALWREHRARWTLPLVIIVIIGAVAIVDHLGSHRIAQVDVQKTSALVPVGGGTATVEFDRPWDGNVRKLTLQLLHRFARFSEICWD